MAKTNEIQQENQNKTKAPINISFRGEITLIGEDIGMQMQKIGDTMVYLIAPLSKNPSEGIGLNEAINSIASSVNWFGDAFDFDVNEIEKSIQDLARDSFKDIRLYLKMAYLYRKETKGTDPVMEFAIGVGVNFKDDNQDDAGKEKTAFSLNNLSFCIWSFNAKQDDEASKARREIIEKKMGIVDLASEEQIFNYISSEEVKLLGSTEASGNTEKIETDEKLTKK